MGGGPGAAFIPLAGSQVRAGRRIKVNASSPAKPLPWENYDDRVKYFKLKTSSVK